MGFRAKFAALGCALVAGCATAPGGTVVSANAFSLVSPGMPDNTLMPPKFAGNFAKNPNCTGQNVSPALQWSNPPPNAKSYALLVDDQVGGTHFFGPCPPRGQAPHHFVYTLIATDLEPYALRSGMKRDELLKALEGHALAATSLVLRFAQ